MHLYQEAAGIIQLVEDKKGTVKNLVMSSEFKNKKQLYALVCESVKYRSILDEILEATRLCSLEKAVKHRPLALVLLYDFLLGKGLKAAGNYKNVIMRHKAALHSQLARLKVKSQVTSNNELLRKGSGKEVVLPRYVRVNTLNTTLSEVQEHFRREHFKQLSVVGLDYKRYIDVVQHLEAKQFVQDPHVQDLLVFRPGTDLHDHTLYKNGSIILQDKASCLPASVLNPPPGSHVIDCCAAPGNKTTHLAAIMADTEKIFAFDKDMKRLLTLNTLGLKAGALSIHSQCRDFLQVDPHDPTYKDVQYVLVDPSCSGSGIVGRLDQYLDDHDSPDRLRSLAHFQTAILKHALSFPKVKKVIYSTCSVHQEENELVVRDVLSAVSGLFTLEDIVPEFPSRGKADGVADASKCLRLSPETDATNGFFVACFKRIDGGRDTEQRVAEISVIELAHESQHMEGKRKKKKKKKKKKKTKSAGEGETAASGHTSGHLEGDLAIVDNTSDGRTLGNDKSLKKQQGNSKNHKRTHTGLLCSEQTASKKPFPGEAQTKAAGAPGEPLHSKTGAPGEPLHSKTGAPGEPLHSKPNRKRQKRRKHKCKPVTAP